MSFQEITVWVLFAASLAYIVRLIYKSSRAKSSCGANCKCGADLSEIETKVK